jgi:hypothetical protein
MSEETSTSSASVAASAADASSSMEVPKYQSGVKLPAASRHSRIFKAIVEFADQMNDVFGKEDVNVNKVYRILAKTSLTNRKVIERHLIIFYNFLETNRMAILARTPADFLESHIELTSNIRMNVKDTIAKADAPTQKIIWQHLFNIMFLYNPDDAVIKNELKTSISENDTKENKFLMDTFSKFEDIMKKPGEENKDPMAMMGGLLQSGFLNEMIGNINSGVNKGDLNIKNLISTVQNLLGNLSETIDKEEKTK